MPTKPKTTDTGTPSAANVAEVVQAASHLFETPDVTPAQRRALATAIGLVAAAIGLHYTSSQLNLFAYILAIAGPLLAAALTFADAHIRHGRALGSALNGSQTHTTTTTTNTGPQTVETTTVGPPG